MADFQVSRAIPVNNSDDRQPTFDVSRAVPATSPAPTPEKNAEDPLATIGDPRQDTLKNMSPDQSARMEQAGKAVMGALNVIRWPFWRFIEHPVATAVVGAQEGAPILQTAAKALQAYVPFKKIPPDEYGSYGQVWDNYYQAAMKLQEPDFKQKTPDWYIAMTSFGSAAVIEPLAIKLGAVMTENAATRVATPDEAAAVRAHFQPLKDSLEKRGLNTEDLHPEGNIIKVDDNNEVFMNKYVSAVIRGDEVRVPRWASIEAPPKLSAPVEEPVAPGKEIAPITPEPLPTTGPEVTLKAAPLAAASELANQNKLPEFKNTEEALAFGVANKENPDVVDNLQKTYEDNLAKIEDIKLQSEKAVQSGDMALSDKLDSEGFVMAQKNQLYSEAHEAATDTGAQAPTEPDAPIHISSTQPEDVKPNAKGITLLQEKLDALKTDKEKFDVTKEMIAQTDLMRKQFRNRILKYKDEYMKEELAGLPKYYVSLKGGIKPDEAMQELRDNHGMSMASESDLIDYLTNLDKSRESLKNQLEKYRPKMVTMRESTMLAKQLKSSISAEQSAQKEMEKVFDEEVKAAKKAEKVAFREGRKFEAEIRKKKYFGESVTPDQRRELYVLALNKGLIYVDYAGKTHDKLQGLIRYYQGASFDQLKNYVSSLSGDKANPSKLFKLYGDINKDAEALKIINKEREGWQDINAVEVYSLDPARIVEKVSKENLWDGNILADNTFNIIAAADEAMFDRKVQELNSLDQSREGVFAGSKESAEIMRKFETKEPLSPKEQRIVDFLRGKYDALIKEANDMRSLLGKKPIPYRRDYMTHIVESNLMRDFFQGNEQGMANISDSQMDAIRKGDYTKGNMPFNKFAQKRLGDKTKLDAIGNYTRYLNTILREVYYTPAITHSRKFIDYALNRQPNAFKAMDRMLNDLKGKVSIVDQNLIGTIAGSHPVKWLRTHISRSALIGNVNFWAMNLSNFSTSYGELGNYENLGMAKFLGSKQWRDFAFANSKMLKGRAIDPDFIDQPMHTKMESFVGGITNMIEYNNIGSTFVGAYFKGVEELGLSEADAIEYADDIARRTQVGYKPYEVNAWMRSNSGKLMSQFQTWSFNAMNHILYDLGAANIPKDIKSMFGKDKTNKTRWGSLMTLVVTAIMANALYKKMGLREPYQVGSAMPSIAGMDVGKFGDIGPARIAKDIGAVLTSKKKETKIKAAERVAGSVVPGGAQAVRLVQGHVFPENKQGHKKVKIKD